ncbi:MAG: DNA topology modulation protein FlaR [Oscillospiraceae bacterium]
MKIQIIGYSGSGKSTLAAALGERLGLPVLHLDTVHFYGHWQERSPEEMAARVRRFLAENRGWVIDGNYSGVAPERFGMSDMTVFLDINRVTCFFAALGRYRTYRGKCRESCGCPEKFDREFIRWLLWEGRGREKKRAMLEKCPGERVILKSRRQVRRFLERFEEVKSC